MAGVDTSIFSQYLQPVKSVADYTAEADAGDSRRLQLMLQQGQLSDRESARQQQQRLMRTLQGLPADATDDQRIGALKGIGEFGQADSLQNGILERQKAGAEVKDREAQAAERLAKVAGERYTLSKSILGKARGAPGLTRDMLVNEFRMAEAAGAMPKDYVDGLVSRLPDDPAQLTQMVDSAFRMQLTPEQVLTAFAPKPVEMTDGKTKFFTDNNSNSPTYGQVTGGAPVQMRTTPGEDLSSADRARALTQQAQEAALNRARIAADAAAGRGVQIRGQNMTDARADQANRLKGLEIAGSVESGLPVLGVPRPTVMPWSSQSNPKDANKVKAAEYQRGSKEIEKDTDAARKEQQTAQAAQRFIELNKKVGTGGLVDRIGVTRSIQGMGGDYSEMEAITARLAPAMREPGSGSTSDFDGKQFERATVGVDKPQKANENIARGMIARAQQAQDYAEFRNTYLEQNGTLAGADRYWKDYADKNPIFDPKKYGTFDLNPARKPWRDHFKASAPAAAAPGRDILSEADAILNGGRGGKR